MATARYDKGYEGWILEYTDHNKIAAGKRGDSKKKKKDREYPKLPARQKKIKAAEMLQLAVELEEATKKGRLTVKDPNKPILAIDYLEKMEIITAKSRIDKTIQARRHVINLFIDFLKNNREYKKCYLHEITRVVARQFLASFPHLSQGTLKKHRKAMATVWNLIIEDFEDYGSKIELYNPFSGARLAARFIKSDEELEAEGKVRAVEKKAFTIEQLREIIARIGYERPILAKVWHFGFLTGWRIGDILRMTWKQVDFTNRTLTNISQKTKIKTVIYLTDGLLKMLEEIKEIQANANPQAQAKAADRVFYYHGSSNYNHHNRAVLDEMGLTDTAKSGNRELHLYCFHSIRGTMKTALKVKDYNESRLDYLVGHRGKGVDGKHYDKFYTDPKAATADILEYLNSVLLDTDNE